MWLAGRRLKDLNISMKTVIAQPTIVGNYEATDMDAIAKLEEEQG